MVFDKEVCNRDIVDRRAIMNKNVKKDKITVFHYPIVIAAIRRRISSSSSDYIILSERRDA